MLLLCVCVCVLPTWRHVLDGSSPHVHLSRVDGVVLQKKHFTCNTEVKGQPPPRVFTGLSALNKYEASSTANETFAPQLNVFGGSGTVPLRLLPPRRDITL